MARGETSPKLEAILSICRKLNSERNLGALLDLIAREATQLTGAERGSIFLLDDEKGVLRSKVALGSDELLQFDARVGIAGAALHARGVIQIDDAYTDPRFHRAIDDQTGFRTRNILAIALRNLAGDDVGVFEVLNKRHGAFTAEDAEILTTLASHAAIALETAQLIGALKRHQDQLEQENTGLRREVEGTLPTRHIVGASEPVQDILRLVEHIRDTSVEVLVTGESGTGKEMVAKAIHDTSLRARHPFVALNCAALPEPLVEAELFGVEKGVATGVERRMGQFERANRGTLFLDEIGDLSLTAQAKILRVLQERVVERVGGRLPVLVDVRIVAATNKNLELEIKRGAFREDLYYRLKVVHIRMPALRELRTDIPLLVEYFLEATSREMSRAPMRISPEALARLVAAPWPGNVRELRNEIRRLVVCARSGVITEADLEPGVPSRGPEPAPSAPRSLATAVADLEKVLIRDTLHACDGNQQRAAVALGMSRQGLINKMRRYGIRAAPVRASS